MEKSPAAAGASERPGQRERPPAERVRAAEVEEVVGELGRRVGTRGDQSLDRIAGSGSQAYGAGDRERSAEILQLSRQVLAREGQRIAAERGRAAVALDEVVCLETALELRDRALLDARESEVHVQRADQVARCLRQRPLVDGEIRDQIAQRQPPAEPQGDLPT